MLSACGEQYTASELYLAATPECKSWVEGSRFELPRGISVQATPPLALKDGGVEIVLIYTLPRGTRADFTALGFQLTQPHGAPIVNGKIVTIYQRGSESRPEIVDVVDQLPIRLAAVGNSADTQTRIRLQFPGQLPPRFDLQPPDLVIAEKRYPVRTYTYRYFGERNSYGMCR
ncbi:hypothetical protein [Janthinobacterium agaricidamnosum]|uniref:Uncharacterized protein n=1 Tax=Janthinobacterium agaricidamnosum NBRC 102515 = DSM 9628 TaxID=1349767 RepID=W0VAK6_9BURK|nr:hypothetical protein [Janthinobacterium agaricidamnosum]CDG85849.1 hypothetical protein GJA_5253 [Janthinobacterium agaricidamnosum NBRC 102515 = DSM 9628]